MSGGEFLNAEQAAALIGAHPQTVRDWIKDGSLPAHKRDLGDGRRGRSWRIRKDDLEAFGLRIAEAKRTEAGIMNEAAAVTQAVLEDSLIQSTYKAMESIDQASAAWEALRKAFDTDPDNADLRNARTKALEDALEVVGQKIRTWEQVRTTHRTLPAAMQAEAAKLHRAAGMN